MVRYIISLMVFFFGIVAVMAAGGMDYFRDSLSFITVVIFPFLFVSVLFGFKEVYSAFSEALKQEANKSRLPSALNFFKMYGKVTWITSFILMLIRIVCVLRNIGNERIGSYVAAMILISPLYGALINLAVIIPFTIFIQKQMKD